MSDEISNTALLSQVYAGATENRATTTWSDDREAKRIERQATLEACREELKASGIGQLIMACHGLKSGRGSTQGQGDDGFEVQSSESNVLSLHYVFPANTAWMGELVTVDLRFSNEGEEIWGIKFLDGIYKAPQIIGGFDHGTKNVGVYERVEFNDETSAFQFLENYIQNHDCAQTLRDVIGRNLDVVEAERKKAVAAAPAPAAQ